MTARVSATRLLLQPVLVALVALILGAALGVVVGTALNATNDPDADWADLGAVIFGALAGAVVAVLLWVAGLIWLSRRLFPRGRRAVAVVLAVVASVAVAMLLRVLDGVLAGSGVSADGLGFLVVLVPLGASAAFLLWDRAGPEPGEHQAAGPPLPLEPSAPRPAGEDR